MNVTGGLALATANKAYRVTPSNVTGGWALATANKAYRIIPSECDWWIGIGYSK